MADLDLDTIREAHNAVTPGPWRWHGNVDTQLLYLSTIDRGRLLVMDFVRWGLNRAQPRFPVNHRMTKASEGVLMRAAQAAVFEVARTATSRDDPRVYRSDVVGIEEPHADYLARSWEYVEFLLGQVDSLLEERDAARRLLGDASGQRGRLRAAIEPAVAGHPGRPGRACGCLGCRRARGEVTGGE